MTIYTDNAATTKMSDTALAAMLPCLQDNYGNPSSLHSVGQRAAEALQGARETVAKCLGCDPKEIIFTSGGSEADNQAIISAARFGALKGKKHIISTAFEHHAVLHTLKKLEKEGFEVELLPVGTTGTITPEQVAAAIRPDTALVTIMYANNEIGSILPIPEIGAVCKEKGVIFHTDAVQAAGHLHINVREQNIDMLSLSGHKFHGPKGSGVLYARKGIPLVNVIEGGAQERGKRAGTENLPAIVGMAAALKEACDHIDENAEKVSALRDKLISGLSKIPHSALNGDPVHRLPGNVNFCVPGSQPCAAGHRPAPRGGPRLPAPEPVRVEHGGRSGHHSAGGPESRGVPAQYEPHVERSGQRQEAVHAVNKEANIMALYTDTVMDHFMNPRNVGEIENPSGVGEVGNAKCGDIMKMYLDIKDGVIQDVKFETFGCGSAIASSSMATEMIKGKTVEEALAISNKDVVDALGGLPAHKLHCSVLAEEAIKSAVKDYYDRNGIPYDHSQFPDCENCEGCRMV